MIQQFYSLVYTKRKKHTKTCSRMFKAPLFIIAKKCKQPKCSPTDEKNIECEILFGEENVKQYWYLLHTDDSLNTW